MFLSHKKYPANIAQCCGPSNQFFNASEQSYPLDYHSKKSLKHIHLSKIRSKRLLTQPSTPKLRTTNQIAFKKEDTPTQLIYWDTKMKKQQRYQVHKRELYNIQEPKEKNRLKISITFGQPLPNMKIIRPEVRSSRENNKNQQNQNMINQGVKSLFDVADQYIHKETQPESPGLKGKETSITDHFQDKQVSLNPQIRSSLHVDMVESEQEDLNPPQVNSKIFQAPRLTKSIDNICVQGLITSKELIDGSLRKTNKKTSLFSKVRKTETMYQNLDGKSDSSKESIVMDNHKSLLAKVQEQRMECSKYENI